MKKITAIVFDVDGVLLDSLEPHLKICQDKNQEYGLNLKIPNTEDLKKLVIRGTKISPMKYFFEAVGFPPKYANKATSEYNKIFMEKYVPKPFPGVNDMLSKLAKEGFKLGIVTSNIRVNIYSALKDSIHLFDKKCIFTKENETSLSKKDALLAIAKQLNINVSNILYVGDQTADYYAANDAGSNFLGVTYGWGISTNNNDFPKVHSVLDIPNHVYRF